MTDFKTPPLNALKVFDAIARTQSISRAAEVLNVTQSAISQQQKLLETHLGVSLFKRHGKRLKLTSAGEIYARHINHVFNSLRLATQELRHSHLSDEILVVNTSLELATQILIPRLSDFHATHPEIDLRLSTPLKPQAQNQLEGIDIGIYPANFSDAWPRSENSSFQLEKIDIGSTVVTLIYPVTLRNKRKLIAFKDWLKTPISS